MASGILPLPQFQAQHPEAVQAAVTNGPLPPQTLLGNLGQAVGIAKGVSDMLGESPEVKYQKDLLQSKEAEMWLNRINDPSLNVAQRQEAISQGLAYGNATGNDKLNALLNNTDPNTLGYKQQGAASYFKEAQNAANALDPASSNTPSPQAQGATGTSPYAQMAQQGSQAGFQAQGGSGVLPDPVPGTTDLSQVTPAPTPRIKSPLEDDPNAAVSPTQAMRAGADAAQDALGPPLPAVVHPVIAEASSVLKVAPTPENWIGVTPDNRPIPSPQLIASGKVSDPMTAAFGLPNAPADPQQRVQMAAQIQNGQAVAAQAAPSAVGFMRSVGRANVWASYLKGVPISDADATIAHMTDVQEQQYQNSMAQALGVNGEVPVFQIASALGDLQATPGAIKDKMAKNPEYWGEQIRQFNELANHPQTVGTAKAILDLSQSIAGNQQSAAAAAARTAAAQQEYNLKKQELGVQKTRADADYLRAQDTDKITLDRLNPTGVLGGKTVAQTNNQNSAAAAHDAQVKLDAARVVHLNQLNTASQAKVSSAELQSVLGQLGIGTRGGLDPGTKANIAFLDTYKTDVNNSRAILDAAKKAATPVAAGQQPDPRAVRDLQTAQAAYDKAQAAFQEQAKTFAANTNGDQLYRTFLGAHVSSNPDAKGHYHAPSGAFLGALRNVTHNPTAWKSTPAEFLQQAGAALGARSKTPQDTAERAAELRTLWEARQALP